MSCFYLRYDTIYFFIRLNKGCCCYTKETPGDVCKFSVPHIIRVLQSQVIRGLQVSPEKIQLPAAKK